MEELTSTKKRIVDEHFKNMLEAHTNMLKQIDEAMRNYQTKVGGDLSIFEEIKAIFKIDRSKILKIRPEDMLEYSLSFRSYGNYNPWNDSDVHCGFCSKLD